MTFRALTMMEDDVLRTPCAARLKELRKQKGLTRKALETTEDYLVTGDPSRNVPLHNTRMLERFKALEGFNVNDRETVIKLIDAMLVKQRVESAVLPVGKGSTKRATART